MLNSGSFLLCFFVGGVLVWCCLLFVFSVCFTYVFLVTALYYFRCKSNLPVCVQIGYVGPSVNMIGLSFKFGGN